MLILIKSNEGLDLGSELSMVDDVDGRNDHTFYFLSPLHQNMLEAYFVTKEQGKVKIPDSWLKAYFTRREGEHKNSFFALRFNEFVFLNQVESFLNLISAIL